MASTTAAAASTRAAATTADDDGTQLTYNETLDALCGFIKTAVHTILCHRQVYPPNVFTKRQRYRVPVWASRHPGLNAYIDDVLNAVKVQLQRNLVRSVHMVITSTSSGAVLERYRFDVDFILHGVPMRDRDFSIPGNMTMQMIELQLRAFMMKLISLDGALYDMEDPNDLSWAMVLDMKDGCEPQTADARGNEPAQGPWVPYDDARRAQQQGEQTSDVTSSSEVAELSGERPAYLRAFRPHSSGGLGQDGSEDEEDDAQIVPIKSLDTGVINLLLYVEEHPSAKRRMATGSSDSKRKEAAAVKSTMAQQQERYRLRRHQGHHQNASSSRAREEKEEVNEAIRIGERDIDQPLLDAGSGGGGGAGPGQKRGGRVRKRKAGTGEAQAKGKHQEQSEASQTSSSDSSDASDDASDDSIKSVNDFAGYGKGPGGVGMSGVGM